jgi:LAS superfamily LD-carboxypeptidase LdcB
MTPTELTGQARSHVVDVVEFDCALHREVVTPFTAMRQAALAAGIDLRPASAFRDFERQLAIWNGKYTGRRPTAGADGAPLDLARLSPAERVEAILRWSALPGASRHHWGTDLDLYDRGAVASDVGPRLEPAEYAAGGPFARAAAWLERHAARFGFFRPYRGRRSGVLAEPWHYSFAPTAHRASCQLDVKMLRHAIAAAPLEGKDAVLDAIDRIHARYVATIDPF